LRQLSPLFRVPGVWFVSLQKNEAAMQIREAPELPIADWGSELSDFAETAALMSNLDLIISIDTATAHLAGALGRPVWTLLPFGADWRWLLNRADSPWYLTMRLFRQPKPGDWETPIMQVAQALAAMTGREGE
jgi:ADP-heptose:LPS heptosyltransferase